jgi:hypothetical protein
LVFSLFFGFPGALTAGDYKWVGQGGEKKWQSHAEFTGHAATNSVYGVGLSPFIPIAQDDVSMWFVNLRNDMFWEHGDFGHEFNLGGGYRRLMGDDGSWILGGYGFFDRMESRYDNHFNQGTLGVEAMWLDWDARINGYLADDDEKLTSNAQSAVAMFSSGTVVVKSGIEQAQSGFDAEVGWRLPFDLDSMLGDTRVYAGGFYFDSDMMSSIAGPKLRAEMRIHDIPGLWEGSRFTVSTSWRWDDERGSDLQGMLSLRIPIGAPTRTAPLTHVERRMTDSVVRDVFIVSQTGLGNAEGARTRTGVVIGDTAYFDEEGDGDITDIEDPGSVSDAIACGENCLLIGLDLTGDVEVDNETLMNGQTVAGGGSELVVYGANSGYAATVRLPGEHSAIITNDDTTAFHLAENNTIAGLTFDSSIDRALELELSGQSTSAALYQNQFFGLGTALEVDVEDDSSLMLYVTDNLFDTVGTGVDLWASDSFNVQLEVHGNRFISVFGPVGTGLELDLAPDGGSGLPSSFALNASGNLFEEQETAIDTTVNVSGDQKYTHTTRIWENTFEYNAYGDYELDVYGSSPSGDVAIDVELRDNISEDGDTFADIYIDPIPYGSIDISIVGNDIEDSDDTPIQIAIYDSPDVHIAITDNTIIDVSDGGGIDIYLYGSGDDSGNTIDVSRNSIFDVTSDAVNIDIHDSYDTTITANDNNIDEVSDGDGIDIHLYETGHLNGNSVTVARNTIDEVNDNGVEVEMDYGFDTTVTVGNNAIRDVGSDGIDVNFYANGHSAGDTATIANNTISGGDSSGIDVYFGYGYDGTAMITNNTISDFGSNGIDVDFDTNGHSSGNVATIDNNTISNTGSDAIEANFSYNYDSNLTISNNTISTVRDDDGIDVDFYQNGHSVGDVVSIENNTISDTSYDGIRMYFGLGYDATVTVANNTISDSSSGDGIDIDFYLNGHDTGNTVTVDGNAITNVQYAGIDVFSGYSYDLALRIANNDIDDVDDGDGIHASVYRNGQVGGVGSTMVISGNTVNNVDDDGIDVYFGYSYDGTLTINNNTITNAGIEGSGHAIEVEFYENGHDTGDVATISNNTIDHVGGGDGINVYFGYGYDGKVTISGNSINDTDDDGIDVEFYENGHYLGNTAWISGNTITNVEDDGISLYAAYSYDTAVTIFDNAIVGSRNDGINVDLYRTGAGGTVAIAGNTVSDVTDDGIDVYFYRSDGLLMAPGPVLTITKNEVNRSGDDGIKVDFYHQDDTTVTVSDNVVSDSGRNGVYLDVRTSDRNAFAITGNRIDESGDGVHPYGPYDGDHGIYAYFDDDSDGNALEVGANRIDESDDYGILVYADNASTTLSSASDNTVLNSGDGASGIFGGPFTGTLSVNGVLVP